jgi:hypothetical protein
MTLMGRCHDSEACYVSTYGVRPAMTYWPPLANTTLTQAPDIRREHHRPTQRLTRRQHRHRLRRRQFRMADRVRDMAVRLDAKEIRTGWRKDLKIAEDSIRIPGIRAKPFQPVKQLSSGSRSTRRPFAWFQLAGTGPCSMGRSSRVNHTPLA